jgi:hypothetical protein
MSTDLTATPDDSPGATLDPALLDGAVLFLNRAIHASGLQLAVTVSAYVTETFFAGDPAALTSKDPQKTASFRALCEREDLQMGASTLHRLVRIGQQARHLPADLAERLSMSQHRALLPVANAQHKQHLARLAVQHGWTTEQLTATVAAEHPQPPNHAGRPKKAEVLKWLDGLQRAAKARQDPAGFAVGYEALQASQQARVKADIQALHQELSALLAAIAG